MSTYWRDLHQQYPRDPFIAVLAERERADHSWVGMSVTCIVILGPLGLIALVSWLSS